MIKENGTTIIFFMWSKIHYCFYPYNLKRTPILSPPGNSNDFSKGTDQGKIAIMNNVKVT